MPRGRPVFGIAAAAVLVWGALQALGPAWAASVYAEGELQRERPRLERAIGRIYSLGIKPALKADELRRIGPVAFEFPLPGEDDPPLNFFAGRIDGQAKVVFPLQSLKLVEDLATAFAWLYVTKRGFGPLDLYFTMLQRKPFDAWKSVAPGHGRPNILEALGVPKDVLKNKAVDELGLRLRNEAFAFIMAHELGHVLFAHKGLADITPAQARADEVESDRFALDVLARTKTAPMGAVLYFQAQIYSLPHRGEFKDRAAWRKYLETASTHPLSGDRIRAMADMIGGPLALARPGEQMIWQWIAAKVLDLGRVLDDVELHNCMVKVAEKAPVSLLRSSDQSERAAIRRFCTSL